MPRRGQYSRAADTRMRVPWALKCRLDRNLLLGAPRRNLVPLVPSHSRTEHARRTQLSQRYSSVCRGYLWARAEAVGEGDVEGVLGGFPPVGPSLAAPPGLATGR
jgi:hypothetical protein